MLDEGECGAVIDPTFPQQVARMSGDAAEFIVGVGSHQHVRRMKEDRWFVSSFGKVYWVTIPFEFSDLVEQCVKLEC